MTPFKTRITLVVLILGLLSIGLASWQFSGSASEHQLRLLFLIHRHGERAPIYLAPGDPHKAEESDIWNLGAGELTVQGKMTMFRLGQYLRRRYSNFLTNDPYEIHSISSDVARCIESAQLMLAGLYRPQGKWIWNENLAWQPIAVHSVPEHDDPMLNPDSFCPNRNRETNEMLEDYTRRFYDRQRFTDEDKALLDNMSSHFGYNFTDPFKIFQAHNVVDLERRAGLELPQWLVDNFGVLEHLAARLNNYRTYTMALRQINAGVLLNDIVDKMKRASRHQDNEPLSYKVHHYSTHDSMMHIVLSTLGLYPDQVFEVANYGSTIMIELLKDQKTRGNHWVRLFYLAHGEPEDNSMGELELTHCLESGQTLCNLDGFDRFTRPYQLSTSQWHRECGR